MSRTRKRGKESRAISSGGVSGGRCDYRRRRKH